MLQPSMWATAAVRVTCGSQRRSILRSLLPRLIARFSAAHPGIIVDVTGTPDGSGSIYPDQFDIALRTLEDVRKHGHMLRRRVGKLPLAVYGARAYFADRKSRGESRMWENTGCFWATVRSRKLRRCGGCRRPPRTPNMLLLLAGVGDGLGICCLSRYLCEGESELIGAFNVPEEHCADLWILRHVHHRDNTRMRAFTDFMAAEFRKVL
jgi:DNA-binding transcriptional LysR family regulator